MSDNPPIGEAVAAVMEKLEAPVRLRRVVWAWNHDHGWPVPKIARTLHEALRAAGLSDDQIDGLGVSHDSIRIMVRGERP